MGWKAFFADRGVEVVVDDVGRPAVPRQVLGEMIAERAAAEAARVADQERRREAAKREPNPRWQRPSGQEGVPAVVAMIAHDREREWLEDENWSPHGNGEFMAPPRKTRTEGERK